MTQGQPEALRLADALRDMSSQLDTPSHERGVVNGAIQELRRQHARIAELEAELVKESARTADYKLRAEQFEQRLEMANKLGNEARNKLAASASK